MKRSGMYYLGVDMLTLTPEILPQIRMLRPGFPDIEKGVVLIQVGRGSPAGL